VGVIWSPNARSAYYASYSYAFLPSGEQLSLATTTADLAPEKSENHEIGARWDVLPRLTLSAALFRTMRRDVRVAEEDLGIDLSAEVVRDELHAVTDAQHRDSRAERFGIDLRRAGLVDAGGAAAEDEPCGIALLQLRPRSRPGHQLAVHLGFTNPARDQLAELRSEVEDQHCLLADRRGGFLARPGSRGGPAQLSPSPCPRAGLAGATCLPT